MFLLVIAMKYAAHICMHEELQNKRTPQNISVELENDFKDIEVHFDLKYVSSDTNGDTQKCTTANTNITWNGKEYTCTSEDIINDTKKTVLTQTLTGISAQLKGFMKVKHVKAQFGLKNFSDLLNVVKETDKSESNKDLHINVLLRPFDDLNTAAGTVIIQIHNQTKQPLQAAMFINVKKIPLKVDSRYNHTLLHETLHALGVSSIMYDYYHPKDSNDPHPNIKCETTMHGYKLTYLVTPYAKKFALAHYGYETVGTCYNGIELENSQGIQMSHPEFRRYYTDMLTGIILEASNSTLYRLSDVSLAILRDTGFYDVDFKGFKPIIWYNPLAIVGERDGKYSDSIPNNAYPENYLIENSNDHTMFDFNGIGDFDYYKSDVWVNTTECENSNDKPDKEYCDHQYFYNPKLYTAIYNEKLVDYALVKIPKFECPQGKAAIPSNRDSNYRDNKIQDNCGSYNCQDDNSSFTITFSNNRSFTCTKEKSNKEIESYMNGNTTIKYYCPDPKQFCLTRKLLDVQKFEQDPLENVSPLPRPTPPPTPTPPSGDGSGNGGSTNPPESNNFNWPVFWQIMVALVVITLSVGIIALAVLYRKKRDEKAEEEEESSYSEEMYSSDSI